MLGTLLGIPAVIHTFDFGGDAARRFGVLDRGKGDGGQVVVIDGDEAYIAMTEDAAGGMQWFRSPDCAHGERGLSGWLLVGEPVSDRWNMRVVALRIAHALQSCPSAFDSSLTRWRSARIDLPWRDAATGRMAVVQLDSIISEHFGGTTIATADHLERFYLARDLGLVRWERWENFRRSQRPDRRVLSEAMAREARCPPLADSVAPASEWAMVDCRTWTNMMRASGGAGLRTPDWPGAALR